MAYENFSGSTTFADLNITYDICANHDNDGIIFIDIEDCFICTSEGGCGVSFDVSQWSELKTYIESLATETLNGMGIR